MQASRIVPIHPQIPATDAEILESSTVARSTIERERAPLTHVEAVVLLVRSHRRLIQSPHREPWPIQSPQDYIARLYAEDDFIRLRVEISKEVLPITNERT